MEERLNEIEKKIADLETQDRLSSEKRFIQAALVIQPNNRYRKELLQVLDG